jgi:putative membrane protein
VVLDARAALANERTFLSWIRCALALVVAGTTVGVGVKIDSVWLHLVATAVPLTLAAIVALLGFARWQRMDTALRDGAFVPPDRDLAFAAVAIVLVAVVAGGVVLARVVS